MAFSVRHQRIQVFGGDPDIDAGFLQERLDHGRRVDKGLIIRPDLPVQLLLRIPPFGDGLLYQGFCLLRITGCDLECFVKVGAGGGDESVIELPLALKEVLQQHLPVDGQKHGLADFFIVVGTSMNVYPAAGLIHYVPRSTPCYVVDPKAVQISRPITIVQEKAGTGVKKVVDEILATE